MDNLKAFKEANERRDVNTLAMFETVLGRLIEAVIKQQPERAEHNRFVLVKSFKDMLASNSDVMLKVMELKTMEPPQLMVIADPVFSNEKPEK